MYRLNPFTGQLDEVGTPAGSPLIFAKLTTDQSIISNDGFVAVTGVSITLQPGTYTLTYQGIFTSSSSVPGMKLGFSCDNNIDAYLLDLFANANSQAIGNFVVGSVSSNFRQIVAQDNAWFRTAGNITVSTPTVFALIAGQFVSTATAIVLKAGCFISAIKI